MSGPKFNSMIEKDFKLDHEKYLKKILDRMNELQATYKLEHSGYVDYQRNDVVFQFKSSAYGKYILSNSIRWSGNGDVVQQIETYMELCLVNLNKKCPEECVLLKMFDEDFNRALDKNNYYRGGMHNEW